MIFLFPTELEAARFRKACPSAEVVICGVGMAAAAATMATLSQRGEEVLLAGIAGAYDTSTTPINSVVEVVSEQLEELPEPFAKRYEVIARWGLPTAKSNSVNRSDSTHKEADIENMEGAAVMAICKAMKIPFSELRAISNRVGDPFEMWSIDESLRALTEVLIQIAK